MVSYRKTLMVSLLALGVVAVVAGQGAPPAQAPQGPARPAEVPVLPPRGAVTFTDAAVTELLGTLKAPAGFDVQIFAAPPIVNYPTCLTATIAGELFVCVDRNGSLQQDPGMGTILRLVDTNRDGRADEYTVFATLDSPRGVVFDGDTLYVMHPPLLTALRDTNNDGIADERKTLVRGLGFGLDFRGADHTTNGVEMGIDGWLYVAVGDYGAVKAVGTDGKEIQLRGGGNVRVRPDGRDLEIYSRGTRNDYDLAIDPYMNIFARGNTNDGGGWDIRLNHFVAGANFGYPSLFKNFADEIIPPLADYRTGSGTGMLYVQDAGLPSPYGDTLYSVDWGTNTIYRHPLTAKGATFTVGQEVFVTLPRPTDLTVDGSSRLYLASWRGGQFRYAGENIGYIARLVATGAAPPPAPVLGSATDARLVELIASANQTHRRFAQQELLRRGRSPERIGLLEKRVLGADPVAARVAAIFTLKQLAGSDAHATLVKAAGDAAVRSYALRALTDRRGELTGVPKPLFLQALSDPDPRVQLQAITGLKRLGATDAAKPILALTASPDLVVAQIAVNAIVSLGTTDAALTALAEGTPAVAKGALRALQQMHTTAAVTGLIASLQEARTAEARSGILQALARLSHREGVWRGTLPEWWGTRPDTTGPYYDPVNWDESERILGVLRAAVAQAARDGSLAGAPLLKDLERNRVVPPGSIDLIAAMATAKDAALDSVITALVGQVRLGADGAWAPALDRLARSRAVYRAAVAKMIAAPNALTPPGAAILRQIATDTTSPADAREAAFAALAMATAPDVVEHSIAAFTALGASGDVDAAYALVWRQFVSLPAHAANLPTFRTAAASTDRGRQLLGYGVLVQLAAERPAAPGRGGPGGGGGGGRGRGGLQNAAVEAARTEARAAIDAAWSGAGTAALLRAIGLTEAPGYGERIQALTASPSADVREAAKFAASKAPAAAPAAGTAPSPPAAGAANAPGAAVVSSVPFDDLVARLAPLTGDVAQGKMLFTRQACVTCHTVTAGETERGPFLGGITTRYSRAEILESILRPNAKVAQGFATGWFETTDKRRLEGFVTRESADDVVVRDMSGAETTLRKAQIANRGVREGSIMPPGLVDGLTLQELASLLAFLGSTTGK
jgi:putative membrane-bound dehydrogenase-like protein